MLATVRPNLRSFWYARAPQENTVASTGFAVLRAGCEIDDRFLYFNVTSQAFTDYLTANAKGAAYPAVDTDTIRRAEIYLPPLPTQRKIAAILSAYDDLIENNTRRIAILEEIAQNLYREWFVHFRFPGHQSVTLVDSDNGPIPEGWEWRPLGDLAAQRRRNVKPDHIDPLTPYIGLAHMPKGSIALTQWGTADETKSAKLAFKEGEILFGKIRPYFHKVGVAPVDGVASTDAIVIVPKSADYFPIVLACVSSREFVDHATQTSKGTKMPRADWDVLVNYPLPLPQEAFLSQFNHPVQDIVSLILSLIMRNRILHRTRDLLLPRLISGELDVSDLNIRLEVNQ